MNRFLQALFGPANPGGTANPESRIAEKIEDIKRAELEAREARERAIEKAKQEEQLERKAVVRKITSGTYEFLTPHFEFVRDSHLELILRDVEAVAHYDFELSIRIGADFTALFQGTVGKGSRWIELGNPYSTSQKRLKSISQIGHDYDFDDGKFTSNSSYIRIIDMNDSTLKTTRDMYPKDVLELKDVPIETIYKSCHFRYSTLNHEIAVSVDALKKIISVEGDREYDLTQEDLKNPEALEDAIAIACVHPWRPSDRAYGSLVNDLS